MVYKRVKRVGCWLFFGKGSGEKVREYDECRKKRKKRVLKMVISILGFWRFVGKGVDICVTWCFYGFLENFIDKRRIFFGMKIIESGRVIE